MMRDMKGEEKLRELEERKEIFLPRKIQTMYLTGPDCARWQAQRNPAFFLVKAIFAQQWNWLSPYNKFYFSENYFNSEILAQTGPS